MDYETLRYERDGHVTGLTYARPESLRRALEEIRERLFQPFEHAEVWMAPGREEVRDRMIARDIEPGTARRSRRHSRRPAA